MTSANFFQDSLLETADDKEQIEDPSQHNINKSQTVNPIARAKLSNPNKRPRSASYCPPIQDIIPTRLATPLPAGEQLLLL
ncbi:hypothetical protein M7I_6024 [Glarea lozoyensis 74030]|uniref:Uncharacterized protein n=1 Tax=Glarea lozoyensis (strain ATCC 74030 / MF5533) TaxID=1104152 RepID=H0ETG2_GLAL7|nr:hypothetical protein M7I_6024 [Glarea lozoyensis 74030]